MRLFVFGANGGCGRHVVELAQRRGHAVTAFVRRGSPYTPPPGVRLVLGEVSSDPVDGMAGHDAIVSCLGNRRVRSWNPWSSLASPPDFGAASARRIVAAMREVGVRRVIAVSAAGVGDSEDGLNVVMQLLVAASRIGTMYADLEEMEDVYRQSGLDWCCVRPTVLTNAPYSGRTRVIEDFPLTARIGRADVAGAMLDLLEAAEQQGRFVQRTPIVTASSRG